MKLPNLFCLKHWEKDHYWNMFGGNIVFASDGGECFQYVHDNHDHITVTIPVDLQGGHGEAHALIAFHVANITSGNVMVGESDGDVLEILIGILEHDHDQHHHGLWDGKQQEVHQLDQHYWSSWRTQTWTCQSIVRISCLHGMRLPISLLHVATR